MKRFVFTVFFLFSGSVITAHSQALYQTGFEATENPAFNVGPLPQNGWIQESGSAISSVTNGLVFDGSQSLEVAADATISRPLSSSNSSVVYIDGWFKPARSREMLDLVGLPASSALFIFQATDGIIALDGNGSGGGDWVETGFTDLDSFIRLTVLLNFGNHTWNLYANTQLLEADLGFKDNSINSLAGLRITSSTEE
ncbi:MAG: hypothetical protein KC931_25945, partial [Candidatus Omnitrophica bacterium]|nr:hypothetical protein [Candidatus Omnitrophota bacterium]